MATIDDLLITFKTDLESATTVADIESLEIKYLGRNGQLTQLLKQIKDVKQEERKQYGTKLNEIKIQITEQISSKKTELFQKKDAEESIDVTLPGNQYPKGSLHLVTYAVEEITKIFSRIGFIRMSYPEVEWEFFSFDTLNMPPNHPARDDFETFFIKADPHPEYGKMVLTPHTSSGQYREMKRLQKPPIRMINIAKTYRPNWDTTHTPMFHQFEGMCVDTNITISDLKGTIDYFAKEFFGQDRKTRLRPFHFQFTEPSFEVDITCGVCGGTGMINDTKCKVCKSGWLELGGSGMVHPNVLKAGGIDPEKYSGWAFGFGVERVMMMKEAIKIDDLRIMYSGDIRFLEQF
jgi:phenylalanyl-tRNA synthetase alpha chain